MSRQDQIDEAFSELLDLIVSIRGKTVFAAVSSALQDLKCAETVECSDDWHTNMQAALDKLVVLGDKGRKLSARIARIKNLYPVDVL